jgi:hypothetical protein
LKTLAGSSLEIHAPRIRYSLDLGKNNLNSPGLFCLSSEAVFWSRVKPVCRCCDVLRIHLGRSEEYQLERPDYGSQLLLWLLECIDRRGRSPGSEQSVLIAFNHCLAMKTFREEVERLLVNLARRVHGIFPMLKSLKIHSCDVRKPKK